MSQFFPTEASDVCEAECVASTCPESVASTCAECDNTAGIIGGVVAVASGSSAKNLQRKLEDKVYAIEK